ncbi:MAG: CU044_5270 family protein [Actinomycetota bacterium]
MNDLELIKLVAPPTGAPDPAARAAAQARLQALIDAEVASRPRRTPLARRRVQTAWKVAAAAVVVAIVVLFIPRGTESATASGFLRQMGSVAEAQPYEPVGKDEFAYSLSRTFVSNQEESLDWTREQWIGPNGQGRIIDRFGDQTYGPGELGLIVPSNLPRDPAELERWLRSDETLGRVSNDVQLLSKIATLLGGTIAPPDVRSALYSVAARIPGTELNEDAVDAVGRPGTAITLRGATQRIELIIAPDTARLLSRTESLTETDEVRRQETIVYLEEGITDSTSERP